MIQIAQAQTEAQAVGNALSPLITHIVNPLLLLLFAVATIVFVYGIIRLIATGDVTDESRAQAKWAVVGGVIGMFIMVSAWGIIQLVANTVRTFE